MQSLVRSLNRLLQLQSRTLPIYLTSAPPWTAPGEVQPLVLLALIAEDQQERSDRVAEYILELGGNLQFGEFSIDYTDMHDLSVDYVLKASYRELLQRSAELESLVNQLSGDARGRALAEEALGAAKGHIQSLQEYLERVRTPVAGRTGPTKP